jgi:hypothetical protein
MFRFAQPDSTVRKRVRTYCAIFQACIATLGLPGILLDLVIPKYQKRKRDLPFRKRMRAKVLTFLILCSASAALSEDFHTIDGKEYKDATVTRMEPDGIVVKTNSGVTKIYFTELPKEVQERFRYDSEKAASYSGKQAANYTAYQKQQEQAAQRQQEELAAKNKAIIAEQNRTIMQDRYNTLQGEEDALLLRIGEAKQPGPEYWGGKNNRKLLHHPNPLKSQLPLLESHLKDIRREKDQIRKQLEKPQR